MRNSNKGDMTLRDVNIAKGVRGIPSQGALGQESADSSGVPWLPLGLCGGQDG